VEGGLVGLPGGLELRLGATNGRDFDGLAVVEDRDAAAHVGRHREGVDEDFLGVLDFGSGQSAQFVSSLSQLYRHHVQLLGTEGTITVPQAFVLRSDDVAIEVTDADGKTRSITVGGDDEYRLEVEDFSRCVLEGRQPEVVSHEDTLWNMRTIDALYASASESRAVRL